MNGSCHCGRVTIRVPARPEYLNACNCTLCTKLGGLWGYFPQGQVEIAGETGSYVRQDLEEVFLATHFCKGCSATTHWLPLHADAPDRMGVNMRLFDPEALTGIQVRYGNYRTDDPDAPPYYREPTLFGRTGMEA